MRARESSPCRLLNAAIETYLDGEIEPSQVVDVEAHLAGCTCCRERVAVNRAIRVSLQREVCRPAPDALRARVLARMQTTETASSGRTGLTAFSALMSSAEQGGARAEPPRDTMRAHYLIPFAVAACLALAFSAQRRPQASAEWTPPEASPQAGQNSRVPASYSSASVIGLDGMLEDLVAQHARPLPPEVTHQEDVRTFNPFVGVPVEPLKKMHLLGARWEGGRMLPLRDQLAAAIHYYSLAGGHRVTVYVYDPHRIRYESRTLRERFIQNEPVYVGTVRGYNVAATEKKGVGYALATDLDEPESLDLVEAATP